MKTIFISIILLLSSMSNIYASHSAQNTFKPATDNIRYVDTENGKNTNDGLEGTPWKTLRKAVNNVTDGMTIYIKGTETITNTFIKIDKSITIIGEGADKTIIQGMESIPAKDGSDVPIYNEDKEQQRMFQVEATVVIKNLTIQYANTTQSGGAIKIQETASLTLENCNFKDCYGGANTGGGAIYAVGESLLTVRNCAFIDNVSSSHGGAIFSQGTLDIQNSLFYNNVANDNSGGAVAISKGGSSEAGSITFINNTVALNNSTTSNYDGLRISNNAVTLVALANNLFYNSPSNSNENLDFSGSPTNIAEAINENNIFSFIASGHELIAGEHTNISQKAKPRPTADELKFDELKMGMNGVYTLGLLEGSLAIDAGNSAHATSTDISDENRDATPDIGASEYIAPIEEVTFTFGASTFTYNGSEQLPNVTTDPTDISYSKTFPDGNPIGAGVYRMQVEIDEEGYQGSDEVSITINKAAISINLTDLNQDYDGSGKSISYTLSPDVSVNAVNITYNGNSSLPAAVGSYTVIATIEDDNYTGSETGTLVINELPLAGKVWDGSWSEDTAPTATDDVTLVEDYTGEGFVCKSLSIRAGKTVDIGSGILDIKGDVVNHGTLIIKSGASLLTYEGNNFTGEAEIKRNTRYSDHRYSFVGSPVKNTSTIKGRNLGKSVYKYDESVAYGDNEGLRRWIKASKDVLIPGRGYTQAFKKLLSFVGEPNSGDIVYTGTYTETSNAATEGWNLLSNPYPSAISIHQFLDANTNIDGVVYIWDDNTKVNERGSNSDYIVVNYIGESSGGRAENRARLNSHLGATQGFFVKISDKDQPKDITFKESMRVGDKNSDDNFFRKASVEKQLLRLSLNSWDGQLYTETLLGFLEDATEGVDRRYDALCLNENPLQLYSKIKDKHYTIQGLPTITNQQIISLGMNISEAGTYTFDLSEMSNIPEDVIIELIDKKLNIVHNLSESTYTFEALESVDNNRFSLNLRKDIISHSVQPSQNLDIKIHKDGINLFGLPIYHISIMDATGKLLLKQQEYNKVYFPFHFEKNKMYIINVNGKVVKQIFTDK